MIVWCNEPTSLCLFFFFLLFFAESRCPRDAETPAGAENVYDPDHSPVQVCLSSAHPLPPKLQTYLIFSNIPDPDLWIWLNLADEQGELPWQLCACITLFKVVLKVRNDCSLRESPMNYFIPDIIYFSWNNLWITLITCKTYSDLQIEPHLTWLVCIVTHP